MTDETQQHIVFENHVSPNLKKNKNIRTSEKCGVTEQKIGLFFFAHENEMKLSRVISYVLCICLFTLVLVRQYVWTNM